jgi:hypothetical protein
MSQRPDDAFETMGWIFIAVMIVAVCALLEAGVL